MTRARLITSAALPYTTTPIFSLARSCRKTSAMPVSRDGSSCLRPGESESAAWWRSSTNSPPGRHARTD